VETPSAANPLVGLAHVVAVPPVGGVVATAVGEAATLLTANVVVVKALFCAPVAAAPLPVHVPVVTVAVPALPVSAAPAAVLPIRTVAFEVLGAARTFATLVQSVGLPCALTTPA
jgi:hypothetical protein